MFRFARFAAPSLVFCEVADRQRPRRDIGTHQYVANRFIEDRVSHCKIGSIEFVTVYDGHGGPQAAEYLNRELPRIFQLQLDSCSSISEALRHTFLIADKRWFDLVHPVYNLGFTSPIKVGACALAVAIEEQKITVASVGDCKCVLALSNGTTVDLNIERNINRPEEQERLKQLHPGEEDIVRCKRFDPIKLVHTGCYVKGRLQPTKSFGDFHLKDARVDLDHDRQRPFLDTNNPTSFPYIDADPDITVTERKGNEKFLIAATDGLWDQFTSQEAVAIVESALTAGLSAEEAASQLVEAALRNAARVRKISISDLKALPQGSPRRSVHDDISVCVVVL